MKTWTVLAGALLTTTIANAGTTNAAPATATRAMKQPTNAAPALASQSLQVQRLRPGSVLGEAKPNEIVVGRLTYSGMAVQAAKARNPLELLNPWAPPQYGSGMDNLVRYNASGTGPMLKLFSIDF